MLCLMVLVQKVEQIRWLLESSQIKYLIIRINLHFDQIFTIDLHGNTICYDHMFELWYQQANWSWIIQFCIIFVPSDFEETTVEASLVNCAKVHACWRQDRELGDHPGRPIKRVFLCCVDFQGDCK